MQIAIARIEQVCGSRNTFAFGLVRFQGFLQAGNAQGQSLELDMVGLTENARAAVARERQLAAASGTDQCAAELIVALTARNFWLAILRAVDAAKN